jgi:hypothetical protein
LYHVPTGKKYYGVQYNPFADPKHLWTVYFTSSKKVHSLIEEYGKDSFEIEIRKTFQSPEEAFNWEQKVLTRTKAIERDDWLNQALAKGPYLSWGAKSEKTRRKMSDAQRGKKRGPISEETRIKMSLAAKRRGYNRKGYHPTEETKQKMSFSQKGKTNIGRKHTEEHKRKDSEAITLWWKRRKENNNAELRVPLQILQDRV